MSLVRFEEETMEAKDENIALETVSSEASVTEEEEKTTSLERCEDRKKADSRYCQQLDSSTFSAGAGSIKTAIAWFLYPLLLLLCFLADIPKYCNH